MITINNSILNVNNQIKEINNFVKDVIYTNISNNSDLESLQSLNNKKALLILKYFKLDKEILNNET